MRFPWRVTYGASVLLLCPLFFVLLGYVLQRDRALVVTGTKLHLIYRVRPDGCTDVEVRYAGLKTIDERLILPFNVGVPATLDGTATGVSQINCDAPGAELKPQPPNQRVSDYEGRIIWAAKERGPKDVTLRYRLEKNVVFTAQDCVRRFGNDGEESPYDDVHIAPNVSWAEILLEVYWDRQPTLKANPVVHRRDSIASAAWSPVSGSFTQESPSYWVVRLRDVVAHSESRLFWTLADPPPTTANS